MEYYGNPAGRLHLLFQDLSEQGNVPLVQCWAKVLNVEQSEVPFELGTVAPLLKDIEARVEETNSRPMQAWVDRCREEWSRPIVPINNPLSDRAAHLLPSDLALDALDTVAEHLQINNPDGRVPEADELTHLAEQLNQLSEDVKELDLPDDLQKLILDRISQIAVAIARIRVSGPGEIKDSVEALIGAIVTSSADVSSRKRALTKVWSFSLSVMAAFSFGTDVSGVLEEPTLPVLEVVVENHRDETASDPSDPDDPSPDKPSKAK